MIALSVLGLVLILLAVASRLGALWLYRRVVASPTRNIEPSAIPGAPWFQVQSDARALRRLFTATYTAFPAGTLMVIAGVLLS